MNHQVFDRFCCQLLTLSCFVGCLLVPTVSSGQTDDPSPGRVVLKSDGILIGNISTERNSDNGRSYVTVQKDDGSIIKLDKSRLVRKIELANSKTFEYRNLAANVASLDDHRKVMNWCLNQTRGRRVFESEIEFHANHILQSAPDDTQARKVLGYEREDGAWIQKDQFFGEHGYTRDGTSWTPIRAAQMEARQEEVDERIADRKDALRKWLRAAKRGEASPDELAKALFEFCDQFGLPLVESAAKREDSPAIRALLIEGIGRLPGSSATRKLVGFAMTDPDPTVRERALTLLGQPHYDAQAAAKVFTEFFASKRNNDIQRAAHAIGELGGTSMISELIEVLVTTHTEKNPNALEAGRLNPTFSSDGGAGLQTGGGPQNVAITRRNGQVLTALKRLTEQNMDFDVDQWRAWNIKSNTYHSVSVRAD